jgi:type IV secretory pathway VirB3-like protein
MENLETRAAYTFLFLSVSSLALELIMRAQEINSPFNPAWLLVHSIFKFVAWIWLGGLAVLAIAGLIHVGLRLKSARDENFRLAAVNQRNLENRIRFDAERLRAAKKDAKAKLERQKKMEDDRIENLRIVKELREIRAKRSPTDAIEAAFAEFLKGG